MNRDQYKTVTSKESFALLIPAEKAEAEGEATFLMEFGGPRQVRAVRLEDLRKYAKALRGTAAAHFGALLALRGALESRDDLALATAMERMSRVYELRKAETPVAPELDRQLGEVFAPFVGMNAEESYKYMAGQRSGLNAGKNPTVLFSYEVSQAVGGLLQNAQIVLWWMNGSFRQAIYCPDMKVALYIQTFFIAPVSGLGFRICPYDGEQFFQKQPNQDYCCPAHRDAHRVARFRAKKKEKKDGTHKAR
jgi:hypothetical protein